MIIHDDTASCAKRAIVADETTLPQKGFFLNERFKSCILNLGIVSKFSTHAHTQRSKFSWGSSNDMKQKVLRPFLKQMYQKIIQRAERANSQDIVQAMVRSSK